MAKASKAKQFLLKEVVFLLCQTGNSANWEDCTFLELAQWHDGIGAVSPVAIELHQDTRRRRKSAVCRYAEEPQAEVDGGVPGKSLKKGECGEVRYCS